VSILTILLVCNKLWALDVLFRYDDYYLRNDKIQNDVVDLFANMDIPLHIAVIPCGIDSTFIVQDGPYLTRLKELQGQGRLLVALHGYTHQGDMQNGEFILKSYDEQRYCLTRGSHFVDSVFNSRIHIFIPPWNRYNQDTQNVLATLGYDVISSDIVDYRNISDSRFQYYPAGIDHPSKLYEILKLNAKRQGLIVCMFHRYDISDSFTIDNLRSLLSFVKRTDGVALPTMDEIYQKEKSFDEDKLLSNTSHSLLSKILRTREILLEDTEIRAIRIFDILMHAIIFVILASTVRIFVKSISVRYFIIQSSCISISLLCVWNQWLVPKLSFICGSMLIIAIVFLYIVRNRYRSSN